MTHPFNQLAALSTTLSTEGAHDFLQLPMDLLGITLQGGTVQMERDLVDHTQDFFFAL